MKKTKALFAVVLTLILTVTFMPVDVMAARKQKPDDEQDTQRANFREKSGEEPGKD